MPDLIPLNRSERVYASLEHVAGSISQVYELGFDRALDAAQVRVAARELVASYPRLRALMKTGAMSAQLEVLDDESELLEVLFDDAFRVVEGVAGHPERLQAYRVGLLGEPCILERALPVRFRLLMDDERPVLMLSVHHLVCDGRGMVQMIDALLGALAGRPIKAVPLDPPKMRAALWPTGLWARLVAFVRGVRLMFAERRRQRGVKVLDALRPLHAFTPPQVLRHTLRQPLPELLKAAKAYQTSLTGLMLAALTQVLAKRSGAVEDGTQEVAIRISVDLRGYFEPARPKAFGNYVASFMVRLRRFGDLRQLMTDVGSELAEGTRRFKDKERGFGLLLDELGTLIGRRLYGLAARRLKEKGKLAPMSCHYSTVGSVDFLKRHDVGLCDVAGYAPNTGLFITSGGFNDQLRMSMVYPGGALTSSEALALANQLEDVLSAMADAAREAQPETTEELEDSHVAKTNKTTNTANTANTAKTAAGDRGGQAGGSSSVQVA